jgi:biopolymer transport protein ExbB/TolQ
MSDLAFASATIFSMKRLFVPESEQQSLVNTLMLLMDMGLALVLVALAIFMGWRLFDLFKKNGLWSKELAAERKINAETEIEESKRKLDELQATQEEDSK